METRLVSWHSNLLITHTKNDHSKAGNSRTSINGHIFQPLQFNDDGSAKNLDCSDPAKWEVNFTLGDGSVASGKATIAADGSPLLADGNDPFPHTKNSQLISV
jgi:hypothetical protein